MLSHFLINQPYISLPYPFPFPFPPFNPNTKAYPFPPFNPNTKVSLLLLTSNLSTNFKNNILNNKITMDTASATAPATIVIGSRRSSSVRSSTGKKGNVKFIKGLSSFNGLKAENNLTSLGVSMSTEQAFAKVMMSCSLKSSSSKGRGGAGCATCNAAGEIFQIAAIMNGLTLVGVAVGFVLLRIEAFVEEAE